MKGAEAYSVRIPDGLPHVGSQSVRDWLLRLFRERTPLAGDPGAGDEVLRLTLPAAQVHALCALADGDPPGVALRRLLATYSRALPAAKTLEVLPAQAVRPRALPPARKAELVPSRASESRNDARGMPGGWRAVPWGFVGWQAGASPSVSSKAAIGSRADAKRKEWLYLALGILAVVGYYALLIFFGTRSGGSGSASPGLRYAAWRPS